MNRNRIALFALMFLLIFNTLVPVLHAQEQGDGQQQSVSEEEKKQRIKDLIEKKKKEQEKYQKLKVHQILVELEDAYKKGAEDAAKRFAAGEVLKDEDGNIITKSEDAYKKGGIAAAKEYAEKRKLHLIEDKYIFVEINLKLGTIGTTFDASTFENLGGKVEGRSEHYIDAYIPIDMIRKIAEEVDEIQFIEIPAPIILNNIRSEGLRNIGFSNYSAADTRGQNVKIGVIDKGFASLSSSISSGELPSNVIKADCELSF